MSALSSLFSVVVVFLLSSLLVSAAPNNRPGPTIPNAGGVALSADGTLAFVSTTSTTSASVYVIPLPITASSNLSPSAYFTNPNSVQYYFIAATVSASPQLIYLMDNQNAQLVSLVYSATTPATTTTMIYNFGIANVDLVDGMYYQQSTGLMYFSLYDHYNGTGTDFVGVLNPAAANPTLSTFFTTSFVASLAGLAVSSSYLYFGVSTAVVASSNTVAQIYSVPLSSVNAAVPSVRSGAVAQLIYQTQDSNLANISQNTGALIYPAAFVLNKAESILYLTDIGNQNAQPASTPHAVYAIWPLYYTSLNQLNLSTIYAYEGPNTEIQQSFALSPDQGTIYYADTGNKNGMNFILTANSSIVPLLNNLPAPPAAPTAGATSAASPTSAAAASSSPVVPPTSAVTPTSARTVTSAVTPTSAVVTPTSTVVAPTSGSNTGGGTRGPGVVSTSSGFTFSDANDALSCLSSDAAVTRGFVASDGGDIFSWSLLATPASIAPAGIFGTGSTGASFIACQANPAGTLLYLLDTRGIFFYVWNVSTPTVAPVVISTFPSEQTGSLTALAIDFTNLVAYIGTRNTDNIYSVAINAFGQVSSVFDAQSANTDITSFALSADLTTLYYGYPAPAQGVAGGINSLVVQAGVVPYSSSPTSIVASTSILYPDSIYINGTGTGQTLYFKDGGPFRGEAGPTANSVQFIGSLNLALASPTNAVYTTLYTTTTLNLPAGLIQTNPANVATVAPLGVTSLIFTTALTIDFITIVNSSTPVAPASSAAPTVAPATSALATSAPATSAILRSSSVTSAPATSPLITSAPATSPLITSAPATSPLITSAPATSPLATSAVLRSSSVTSAPATSPLVTSAPATSPLVTSAPATSPLVTSAAATSALATSTPATSPVVTSAALRSSSVTSAAATSALLTSAAATSALATSAPATSAVVPTSAVRASSSAAVPTATTGTGRIIGDPMFVGFLRQRYQVHGMDGVVYNILSQASVSINALFVFLESGACPVVDGVKATNCWSHPGSYFGSLSMQTAAGDQLEIVAGSATVGFSAVRFDGETVKAVKGVEGKGAKLSFQMLSTHSMAITIDNYRLVIENSDLFVNLVSIEVLDWQLLASVDQPHGLLGQTWKPSRKGRGGQVVAVKDVAEGDVDDYVIASDSIFGTDFLYNKFAKEQ